MNNTNKYKNKLKKGMVFKNYGDMCKYLKEPTKSGGRGRDLQASEWKRYFDWEMDSKYVRTITEVYERDYTLIEKVNQRNTIFKDSISLIILNLLMRSESNPYVRPKKRLTTNLGLTNETFYNYETNGIERAKYAKANNHLYFSVDDYFKRASDNNRSRLKSSLEYLQDNDFITWRNSYILITEDKNRINAYRQTTEEEEDIIRDLRRDLLTQMNFKGLSQVYQQGKQKEFFQYLNPVINNEFGIDGYYPVISISFNHELIQDYLEPRNLVLSDDDLNFEKRRLNDMTVDRIIKIAQKDKDNVVQQDSNDIFVDLLTTPQEEKKAIKEYDRKLLRGVPDYMETTKELVAMTIRTKDYKDDVTFNMDDWSSDIIITSPLDDISE